MPKPLESFTTGIQQNSSCMQNPLDKLNSLLDASRCQKKTIRVNNLGIKIVNQKNDHPTINGISKLKMNAFQNLQYLLPTQKQKKKINMTNLGRGNPKISGEIWGRKKKRHLCPKAQVQKKYELVDFLIFSPKSKRNKASGYSIE